MNCNWKEIGEARAGDEHFVEVNRSKSRTVRWFPPEARRTVKWHVILIRTPHAMYPAKVLVPLLGDPVCLSKCARPPAKRPSLRRILMDGYRERRCVLVEHLPQLAGSQEAVCF